MAESFEAARSRVLQTWVRDRRNLEGFECDLDHGLEECRAIASWKIVQTGEAERMFSVRCRSSKPDADKVVVDLLESFDRYVAYRGDNAQTVERNDGEVVFRFATRARGGSNLVATGEIRVTLAAG